VKSVLGKKIKDMWGNSPKTRNRKKLNIMYGNLTYFWGIF